MSDRLLHSLVVTLGKPAPEAYPEERATLHAWLIEQLTAEAPRVVSQRMTINVLAEEIADDNPTVSARLDGLPFHSADGQTSIVLDLTCNPYEAIRDPLAYDAANIACEWVSKYEQRTAVILLPRMPARGTSLFWKPLEPADVHSKISVYSNDGKAWLGGRHLESSPLGESYAEGAALLRDSAEDDIHTKILKELGHFRVKGLDQEWCARYFFDAELAVVEVARMLATEVGKAGIPSEKVTLLTHGPNSPWLYRSVLLALRRLSPHATAVDITDMSNYQGIIEDDRYIVPVFDVVNTGQTCKRVVEDLLEAGVPIAGPVLTVMLDQACPRLDLAPGHLVGLLTVTSEKCDPNDCVQCECGLSFTTPLSDDYAFRPYDMWHLLLSSPWKREPYAPESLKVFPEAPDMAAIFERYGGWIGYKLSMLVQAESPTSEIVFVCPNETEIDQIFRWLGPRFGDKAVTVRIPRNVLNAIKRNEPVPGNGAAWRSQLEYVAGTSGRLVVALDEFNASNTTAKALISLIKAFEITVDFYLPIFNRVADAQKELGVKLRTCYEIPSPRSAPSVRVVV